LRGLAPRINALGFGAFNMSTFQFELVSPEKVLFSGQVEQVVVPGMEGEFTVLPGHAPYTTALRPGIAFVVENKSNSIRIVIKGGFADVNEKGLTILADGGAPIEDVTIESITQEIIHAETLRVAAKTDSERNAADEHIAQLNELKGILSK
jgi:F-type H+-transporting ATPase subunit epsilon